MVKVDQIYTGCVAEAAYFIVSNGECAVIDPLRETTPYKDMAAKANAKLKYIFETHFHADFVSGHVDLHKETGATIVFGPLAEPFFEAHIATEGEVFHIGGATLTVIHTPGHTMESVCYLLRDEEGKNAGLFTGDTLFIGDVGRPDLVQKADNMTPEILAAHLYNSLRTKVMTLPDDTIIYPAHGAGSACGKSMSKETTDTLGHQKKTNYALRADMTVEEFTHELLTGLAAPPSYFPKAVAKNKHELPVTYQSLLEKGRIRLSLEEFEKLLQQPDPPIIIDTRNANDFCTAHIRGTVFTGLDDGNFAPWIATAVGDVDRPYVLIPHQDERVDEAVTRLSRFGFDNPLGHLAGGFATWTNAGKPTDSIENITADELAKKLVEDPNLYLVDVRNPGEHLANRHSRSVNVRLNAPNFDDVAKDRTAYCHCAGGYRSVIFISLLRRIRGPETKCVNIRGGFGQMVACDDLKDDIDASPCQKRLHAEQAEKAAARAAAIK